MFGDLQVGVFATVAAASESFHLFGWDAVAPTSQHVATVDAKKNCKTLSSSHYNSDYNVVKY